MSPFSKHTMGIKKVPSLLLDAIRDTQQKMKDAEKDESKKSFNLPLSYL